MTAMEIFERCRAAEGDKRELRERIARYHDSATRMGAALDGIGARSTSEPDKLSAIMAEIDLLERGIRQRNKEYAAEVAAACRLLDLLPEAECRIIHGFYMQGKTLAVIARELAYSYGYVRSMKGAACSRLEGVPEEMVDDMLPAWYLQVKG